MIDYKVKVEIQHSNKQKEFWHKIFNKSLNSLKGQIDLANPV